MRARAIVFLGCIVVWGGAAHAQAVPPRFEVGGGGGVLAGGGSSDGFMIFTVGPRLTLNVTPRDGLEIAAEIVGPVEGNGLYGLYVLQYKRTLTGRVASQRSVFMTAGAGGTFEYERSREFREERPDGSVFVQPPYTHASVDGPMFVAVGVGFERVLARYVATRGELQLAAFRFGSVGVRGTFGVSIPIGGYRVR